jgi:quercetin dioxygenase-like cupin family protein
MDVIYRRASGGQFVERSGPFTGTAWGDHLLDTDNVAMSNVYFAPGARTFWHVHDGGQLLTVTSGEGLVVSRDGTVARVRAGDMVWTRPGEEHWHGAASDTFFVHTSMTIDSTTWLEEVERDDYERASAAKLGEQRPPA